MPTDARLAIGRNGSTPHVAQGDAPILGAGPRWGQKMEVAIMDELKHVAREVRDDAKKAWRGADGEDPGDKAANLGDDVRRNAANAGDDMRRAVRDTQDKAHHTGHDLDDDLHRTGRDPADIEPWDVPR